MTYTVLYRVVGSDGGVWEKLVIKYPSRCVAEAKVAELVQLGHQARFVLTTELGEAKINRSKYEQAG